MTFGPVMLSLLHGVSLVLVVLDVRQQLVDARLGRSRNRRR